MYSHMDLQLESTVVTSGHVIAPPILNMHHILQSSRVDVPKQVCDPKQTPMVE